MVSLELRWVRLRGARSELELGLVPSLVPRVALQVLMSAQAMPIER